jgi:hypothetical protein
MVLETVMAFKVVAVVAAVVTTAVMTGAGTPINFLIIPTIFALSIGLINILHSEENKIKANVQHGLNPSSY